MILQTPESVKRIRKEHNITRITEIPAVFNQCPVTVKEHGGQTVGRHCLMMASADH
jgi:hypothetical protein